jgi:hypothetical protein
MKNIGFYTLCFKIARFLVIIKHRNTLLSLVASGDVLQSLGDRIGRKAVQFPHPGIHQRTKSYPSQEGKNAKNNLDA